MKSKLIFICLGLLLVFFNCQNESLRISQFNEKISHLQKKYAPDRSLEIFQVQLTKEKNRWILWGETTLPEAKVTILSVADSLLGRSNYENNLKILPDSTLGDSTFGIVKLSVVNLRDEPDHAAELVDQNIMGQILRLLKKKNGWYLVQTEYHYIGWMTEESFVCTDVAGRDRWKNDNKVRVVELFPLVYSQPDENSEPICDVVLNALLKLEAQHRGWAKVSTPDGRIGYIQTKNISTESASAESPEVFRKNIIKTARKMMGIPYLWGGNSSKANDCSGFAQTVFRANGIALPRDAHQQAQVGDQVILDDSFSNLLPGDLLFFGSKSRITHVGISLGGAEFIHQSDMVRINSLDSLAVNYSGFRRHTLKSIKRVL